MATYQGDRLDVGQQLEKAYFDPSQPVAFSGARNVINKFKKSINKDDVLNWLRAQDSYTRHHPTRRRFQRLHYDVSNIDDVWEADLADMQSLKSYNDGYRYILVVIDVLSKYAWVEALKDKSAPTVLEGFKKIFKRSGRTPGYLQTDKGKEFVADTIQKYLSTKDINFRVARNPDIKAAIVERFNRTLKERMWRYFTYKKTHRWIDVLQKLVDGYNHTKHTSIKMEPAAVTIDNAIEAWRNIQRRHQPPKPRRLKYKVDDYVRISKQKAAFDKGYEAGWTEELFQVTKAKLRQSLPVYELKDLAGEPIEGYFYEQELTLVNKDLEEEEFLIEEIIQTRGRGKKKEVLVKWKGYPDKFNSWIPAEGVKNYAS